MRTFASFRTAAISVQFISIAAPRIAKVHKNAEYQNFFRNITSRPGSKDRRSARHRSWKGRHKEILESGDLVSFSGHFILLIEIDYVCG